MNFLKLPVKILGYLPRFIIKPVAFKYVAGEKLEEAIDKAIRLNQQGFVATMDILGESSNNEKQVESYVDQYKDLVRSISLKKIKAGISIKPTALGLLISYDYALSKFQEIIKTLKKDNIFLRIDMEDSPYTDLTIKLYQQLKEQYPRIGIVFQAYLKRTLNDLEKCKTNGDVRICKGIYIEPSEIAIKGKDPIRQNYLACLKYMLNNGFRVGIATHDDYLIQGAISCFKNFNIEKEQIEFQMLYGVRTHVAKKLADDGYKVRLYIPFGKDWYAYSMRRMYENPYIAFHVTKALFWDPIVSLFNR